MKHFLLSLLCLAVPLSIRATSSDTTANPAPTIQMQAATFPNAITIALNAKSVYQNAIILQNHVNSLAQQIQKMQNDTDPNNSILINQLYSMNATANDQINTLNTLSANLTTIWDQLTQTESLYNDVNGNYTCMAQNCHYTTVTSTIPPTTSYSCGRNFTANDISLSVSYAPPTSNEITTCNYVVIASKGFVGYNITVYNGSITAFNVNTGVAIGNYNKTGITDQMQNSNTNIVQFVPDYAYTANYTLSFINYNPCSLINCDVNTTNCTLNSQGQPYCICKETNACIQINTDQLSCSQIDPCNSAKAKRQCVGKHCSVDNSASTCSFICPDSSVTASERLLLEGSHDFEHKGFFSRWVF